MSNSARPSGTTTSESLPGKASSRTSGSVVITSNHCSDRGTIRSLGQNAATDRSHDLLIGVADQFTGRGGYQFPDHLSTSDYFFGNPDRESGHKSVSLDSPNKEKGSKRSTSVLK